MTRYDRKRKEVESLSEFKKNIRKALAGILTVAMVITSGAIPSSVTSVQAAEVYNDTTTALSSLAGSTGLKIYRLTSDDAGKELTSGIYYVDEDLTFTGADSTSSSQAGGNGLKIADGATVYIYIADGKTLTATGGNGYAATAGVLGEDGSLTFSSGTYSGATFNVRSGTATQGKGKAGGNGASGGGAGIYVPQNANFAVMGQGKLNAIGGDGGNAQIGGQGGKTNYYYVSFEVYGGKTSPAYSQVLKSLNDYPDLSITGAPSSNIAVTMSGAGATGAGGSGGGGAGGGGAAVGSNGANGSTGGQGGATSTRETIGNGSTASTVSSGTSGKIYIQGVDVSSCVAGAGGSTTSQQYSAKANTTLDYKDYYDTKGVNGKYLSYKFYITEGQAGGVGGAGGNGAVFGNGGSGGAGGTGGNSGSFRDSYDKYTSCAGDAKVGADGASGASGTGANQNLNENQYPYNTITFTNAKSNATQNYYITKQTQITVPDYEVEAGKYFVGWKVTTPATVLPSSFGEQTCGLETAGTVYKAGDTITVTGVYGNVVLEAVVVTHTHSWNYEVDSTDKSKIIAYCSETENSEYCTYQKDKALTLTLSATNAIYSGKAYTGADVEENITSVTKDTANIEYYQVDTENTTDGGTKLSSAPTNAGYYYAAVTLDGATAKAAFTISAVDLDESGVTLEKDSFERTDSEISPKVTVKVTVDGKEITLTEGTDYELSGDTSKTDAGSYTLTVTGKGNYAGTINKKWEITKQKFTVTAEIDGWTYGDTAKTPGITDSSNPGNGKVTYTYYTDAACTNKTTSADGAASDGAAPKNAGTYYVKATIAETDNYAAGSGTKEFTIEKKEIGIEWSGDSFTYNGKLQTPTAKATGLLDGDTCTITVTGGQKDTNAKAGNDKYTATADAVDNANYTLPATGTTHEFTITPAELTVTWDNTELTYNGKEQAPTAELNGLMEGDTCKVTVTGGQTDANVKTNKESYTATAGIDDKNYELKDATGTFKILPKSINGAEVKLTPGDVVHSGEEFTQTVDSVTLDGLKLTASNDYEIADSSKLKATEIGIYTVTVNGIGNYKDTASVEWKIKDENPPTGEITIAENKWTSFWNGVTFGHFFKETQTVTIKASDVGSGVDKIYYYNSNEALQEGAVKALADDKWTEIANGGSYNVDAENNYVVYAKITDKSGNETYISSEGFVIDKTAPKIEGVENGKTYCIEKEITITDSDLDADKVTVNGNKIALADGKYTVKADTNEEAEQQKYTILAEDKAGNKTELTITLRKSHDEVPYENVEATCTKDGHTGGSYCSVCGEVIQAPKVVKARGHIMPADWTIEKEATASEEGIQSKICEREGCGYKMYQSIPATGTTDIGNFDKYAEIAPDALVKKALFDNKKSDILSDASKIFTSAQKAQIKNDGVDAKVWIEISKTDEAKISAENKLEVQKKAEASVGSGAKVSYFDADLFSQFGNSDKTKISDAGVKVKVKITIPDALLNHSSTMVRQYKIIRLHTDTSGSTVDVLDGDFDSKTNEFTFETDKFSTYAIAYNDKNNSNSPGYNPGIVVPTIPSASQTPGVQPSITPTSSPETSTSPSETPDIKPTAEPTKQPVTTAEPTKEPEATVEPTAEPTVKPTEKPSVEDQSGLTGSEVSKLKLPIFLAKGKGGDKKVTISWAPYKGVDGYDCYWSYCNGKQNFKKFTGVKASKYRITHKNLKNNREYKYFVAAYKMVDGKKVYLAKSNQVHVAMKNAKKTNAKNVTVNKTSVTLKVGKTFAIKSSTKLENAKKKQLLHADAYRYYTSDKNVAYVSKKGKIKAVKKGRCVIYVLANNGVYRKIKVIVK